MATTMAHGAAVRIGELAARSGVTPDTLRDRERLGLLRGAAPQRERLPVGAVADLEVPDLDVDRRIQPAAGADRPAVARAQQARLFAPDRPSPDEDDEAGRPRFRFDLG